MVHGLTPNLVLALAALPVLAGCGRAQQVPTSADNRAMEAASNRLDNATDELDQVDQRLPAPDDSNETLRNL